MTDQPETTAAPATVPVDVKVIPARVATFQGVETRVPATVSVNGKPVARCEDEAVAHLVAAAYAQGSDAFEAMAGSAQRIADLEQVVHAHEETIATQKGEIETAASTIADLTERLRVAEDEAAAANQVIEGRDATIASLQEELDGYRKSNPTPADLPEAAIIGTDPDSAAPRNEGE